MNPLIRTIQTQFNRIALSPSVGAVPGVFILILVVVARLTGSLQSLEKVAFDDLLRSRPAEPLDERILIVEINEDDIQTIGTYPIPDDRLAGVLKTLQQSSPAVIGLDLFRDLPESDRTLALNQVFETHPNIIGIERVELVEGDDAIAPPPALPPEQVGFVNALLDPDGYLRRSLLGAADLGQNYRFSLTIRLAEVYLATYGISLENGIRDPLAMRFGHTEIPRFHPNTGGYVRADAGGVQTLLNVRSGISPFRIVSFVDVEQGRVPEEWIRDRIVLVGVTATSAGDFVNSAATQSLNPGLNTGVEMQAHAASQIINAVLENRPLMRSWNDGWEYLWIIGWGVAGIGVGFVFTSSWKILGGVLAGVVVMVGICYGAVLLGWWIPLVPPLLVLTLNGTTLAISRFYQYEQSLKTRLQERQLTLEHAFDALHNGPLQSLARMLREARDQGDRPFITELESLNLELRSVYESLRQDVLTQDNHFHVNSDLSLDLNQPLHEVLYEIYDHTLTRDFPNFGSIKLKVVSFEEMNSATLTMAQKRGLCRFLEEALCNVGKYATNVTRLTVSCKSDGEWNHIVVQDNGQAVPVALSKFSGGRGTQQARNLARQLGGTFRRYTQDRGGVSCELHWPSRTSKFFRLRGLRN